MIGFQGCHLPERHWAIAFVPGVTIIGAVQLPHSHVVTVIPERKECTTITCECRDFTSPIQSTGKVNNIHQVGDEGKLLCIRGPAVHDLVVYGD
jgi:hypothetical protein